MATEKKSWNAMSAKEQDDRRKEERLMKRLENNGLKALLAFKLPLKIKELGKNYQTIIIILVIIGRKCPIPKDRN